MKGQCNDAFVVAAHRARVRATYDGAGGALLATASALSGNLAFAERLFRNRIFELQGLNHILDVGSGAGQLAGPMLKYASLTARVVCSDLSPKMLRRAKARLRSPRASFVSCDVTRLPFDDETFDGVTCGFVLEHLTDPREGLAEISRVLRPGGRFMLLILSNSLMSTVTAKLWHCRTFAPDHVHRSCKCFGFDLRLSMHVRGWQRLLRGDGLAQVWQKR